MNFDLNDFQQKGTQRTAKDNGELNDFDKKIFRMRVRESNRKWIGKKLFNIGIYIGVGFLIVAYYLANR